MSVGRRALPRRTARIGFFGLFGCGNSGNDGSLDAVLRRVRLDHDDDELVVICREPDRLQQDLGIAAVSMLSYRDRPGRNRALSLVLRIASKVVDPLWIFLWVRRLDVIVVPGMGVFEQQIRVRPWGLPYSLFWMSVCARLAGTKVAYLSVGAEPIDHPITRRFIVGAASRATYCSFRDDFSHRAMREMGADPDGALVCPDVVFGLPVQRNAKAAKGLVGVGVMAYYGPTDDKRRYAGTHEEYVKKIVGFVSWLVETGHPVRLLCGDVADERVAVVVRERVLTAHPGVPSDQVVVAAGETLAEILDAISGASAVVATRFHNVLCALLLAVPSIALGYGGKHDDLMTEMGLGEMSAHVATFEVQWLIERFQELEARSAQVTADLKRRTSVAARAVDEQHDYLETQLLRSDRVAELVRS